MLHAPGELLEALETAHRERWTHADELLALLLEKLDQLVNTVEVAWMKDAKQRMLMRYPRPVDRRKKRRKTSPAEEIRRFFRGK